MNKILFTYIPSFNSIKILLDLICFLPKFHCGPVMALANVLVNVLGDVHIEGEFHIHVTLNL